MCVNWLVPQGWLQQQKNEDIPSAWTSPQLHLSTYSCAAELSVTSVKKDNQTETHVHMCVHNHTQQHTFMNAPPWPDGHP